MASLKGGGGADSEGAQACSVVGHMLNYYDVFICTYARISNSILCIIIIVL